MNDASRKKIVVAVNKTLEPGVAMNAAAHAALGLAARAVTERQVAFEEMGFLNFEDAAGGDHAFVSALSLVVLRSKSGDLRKLREAARQQGLLSVDFIQTMTGGTYVEQLARTRAAAPDELIYYAVAVFGAVAELDPLTRRMSLWS